MAAKAAKRFIDGGKPGARTAVTPASLSANAAKRALTFNVALGTGAVSTQTVALGTMPVAGKILDIAFSSSSAVTGTSLTAEVKKNAADGNSATTLQSAATDIKVSASTDLTKLAAALTATTADLTVAADLVLSCVFTASSITAGPGFVAITITYVPSEDSKSSGVYTTGNDL